MERERPQRLGSPSGERNHRGWEARVERETTRAGKPDWRKKSQGLGSPSGERDHKGWGAPVEKETTRAGKPEWTCYLQCVRKIATAYFRGTLGIGREIPREREITLGMQNVSKYIGKPK